MPENNPHKRLPYWLRKNLASGAQAALTGNLLDQHNLNTICRSGRCPNRNECYSGKRAAFLILGPNCTRRCLFCSVKHGDPAPPDEDEGRRIAEFAKKTELRHLVLTSVTRDDLKDAGAGQFVRCVREIRKQLPQATIEVLTPDFRGCQQESAEALSAEEIDVFNHNMETVKRLHGHLKPGGDYHNSLNLLRIFSSFNSGVAVKSGALLGLGESKEEVVGLLEDLNDAGCRMVTLGQYLAPGTDRQCPVERFVTPDEFAYYRQKAIEMGFLGVSCGPFVRSSYHAGDAFVLYSEANK